MNPTRLRECLAVLDWSQRGLADVLETDDREVRRWASGQSPIPPEVAQWLEALVRLWQARPLRMHRVHREGGAP